jgi:hypothetical protein
MALCPECLTEKPLLATRCPNCTSHVEIGHQIAAMMMYYGSIMLTCVILLLLLSTCSG